jgi:hypothetical protein
MSNINIFKNETNEMGNIFTTPEDLVFNEDKGITSSGFSVSSIMMKSGLSPIMTMNMNSKDVLQNGGSNKVSDLFQNLAVPSWATMHNIKGGEYKEHKKDNSDSDSDIDDDLHEKLLDLVKEKDIKKKNNKNKKTKKHKTDKTDKTDKIDKTDKTGKKNITKKIKKNKKNTILNE